jgi:dimethylglycine dehydrogenase
MRWFKAHLADPDITVENVTDSFGGFAVFGPQARAVLQALTTDNVSNQQFPFLTVRRMAVALAPAIVARLSVTGELGFEIYVPTLHMLTVFNELNRIRHQWNGRWVGMYALNSLRLEKSFGIWSREFSRDYSPRMAGIGRFIDYEKHSFVGREAALLDRATTPPRRLATLVIDADSVDAAGYEPVLRGEELVGFVTSGGFGHCVNKSISMGYVDSDILEESEELTVTILGQPRPARLAPHALVDPAGLKMRS